MYLVHLSLEPPRDGEPLPAETHGMLVSAARAPDGLEHVTVHASARPHPVIGFFLRAPSLAAAEATAELLWHRAAGPGLPLCRWVLRRAEAPLLLPDPEWSALEEGTGEGPAEGPAGGPEEGPAAGPADSSEDSGKHPGDRPAD